jgi:molecular chaperone DnaK
LKEEQIERMMKEAESHAEEDKKRKEQVELRNEADSLVYSVEKTLKELGDKVAAEQVDKANKAKEELASALKGEDYTLIREKKESLEKVLHELSATLYQQTAQAGAGQSEQQAPHGEEGPTVDADYEVKDEK